MTLSLSLFLIPLLPFYCCRCGPCKQSKPQLEQLAEEMKSMMPFAITYEDDLQDYLHTFNVRAFPTYAVFVNGKEVQRVEGVNFDGIRSMVQQHGGTKMPETGGNALGGGSSAALSPQEARLQRLAKLGGGGASTEASAPAADSPKKEEAKKEEMTKPMDTSATDDAAKASEDVEMVDATKNEEKPQSALDKLDKEALETLTGSMGFSLLRAQKGLLFSSGGTVESAVEWLMEHQDDEGIDQPIPDDVLAGGGATAQSYKCNECGKILSNMANLELHANKTGHSDFEESTQHVKPLTPEEKAAKIAEIKELLKTKRAEREEAEKVDQTEREKQRRFMGKEMAKTREQMEIEQRKRDAKARKREKEAYKKERERIRAELEKDKMERQANKGKLSSKLGVDGYNPDGIQYDVDQEADAGDGDAQEKPKKPRGGSSASSSRIDEYIQKISSYKAGGDGGKCLKILKAYVGNVADNPDESKFQSINMENKAFKAKVKPFVGAKQLLQAVGFSSGEPGTLALPDDFDRELFKETKAKLEAALAAYG